jgi:hypothetical protein
MAYRPEWANDKTIQRLSELQPCAGAAVGHFAACARAVQPHQH